MPSALCVGSRAVGLSVNKPSEVRALLLPISQMRKLSQDRLAVSSVCWPGLILTSKSMGQASASKGTRVSGLLLVGAAGLPGAAEGGGIKPHG